VSVHVRTTTKSPNDAFSKRIPAVNRRISVPGKAFLLTSTCQRCCEAGIRYEEMFIKLNNHIKLATVN